MPAKPFVIAGSVCVLALVVILIGKFHGANDAKSVSVHTRTQVTHLLREGCKYAVLCDQDQNALVSLMHCCAAINYLEAALRLVSGSWCRKVIGADPEKYLRALSKRLNSIINQMGKLCPSVAVKSQYAAGAGWVFA